jgi:hypothetical protein
VSDQPPTNKATKKAATKRAKPGRPALDQAGKPSPQIAFRVGAPVRKRAKEVAAQEGLTVSQLSRKALREYLGKHHHEAESAGSAE